MRSRKRKSKTPSSTKELLPAPLESAVFFVDRSSGKYNLVNGLRELGLNVERHDDHFPQDAEDIEWLGACGKNKWIVISSDKRIKKNYLERQVILSSKVAAFFFTSSNLTSEQQLNILSLALKRIAHLIGNQKRPFIARLNPSGKVELWLNHKGEDLLLKRKSKNP